MDALNVPELLRRYGLRPDKSLGQNFLVDETALERVAAAAGLQASEIALEIGPGLGSLTRHLAGQAAQVIAVELDGRLLPALRAVVAGYSNVRIVQGDILDLDPAALLDREPGEAWSGRPYCVVANIPYYITSALIRHLLEARALPRCVTLTVQREVAERITAAPGDLSLLALSVQVYGEPRLMGRIPAGAFYPPPQVDSAIIRIDLFPQPRLPGEQINAFFHLAKAGFSQKRKTLRNALADGMRWSNAQAQNVLEQAGVDPQRRAETLSLDEWRQILAVTLAPPDQQAPGQ